MLNICSVFSLQVFSLCSVMQNGPQIILVPLFILTHLLCIN